MLNSFYFRNRNISTCFNLKPRHWTFDGFSFSSIHLVHIASLWVQFFLIIFNLAQITISLFCFCRRCLCWSMPIRHLSHVPRFQGLNCHYFLQIPLVVVGVEVCLLHLLVSTKLAYYLCPVPIALDSCSIHLRRPFSVRNTLPKRKISKSWTDWWRNHRLNNFHRSKFSLDSQIWPWFLRWWCHCVSSLFPEMNILRIRKTE